MKNRAKCKLCQTTIESFHPTDYVTCKCGEIVVDGGDALRCAAKDWKNFFRVDDLGNEISVKVEDINRNVNPEKPTREDMIKLLDVMIENIENLPSNAMSAAVTNYDLCGALLLLSAIFKTDSSKQ